MAPPATEEASHSPVKSDIKHDVVASPVIKQSGELERSLDVSNGMANNNSPPPSQPPFDHVDRPNAASDIDVAKDANVSSAMANAIKAKRSVSFSVSPSRLPPGVPKQPQAKDHENDTESSSDETTAIIRNGRFRRFGGTYGSSSASDAAPHRQGADGRSSRTKRRKSDTASPKAKRLRRRVETSQQDEGASNPKVAKDQKGWWIKLVDKFGSIELENKGSVARDHLSIERTFLAWLRTSLSFASIGVAVTQLFRLNTNLLASPSDPYTSQPTEAQIKLRQIGKPLGATFLGVAIAILMLGFHRFFQSQHYVIRGKFPAGRGSILITSFIAISLIVGSLVAILSVGASTFNKP